MRILVVEDDAAILMLVEDMLNELGCEIAGSASRLSEALQLAQECAADVSLLDVNLAGEPVYPVAEAVRNRGIPVIFCTGYGGENIDEAWRSQPVLQKPYRIEHLAEALVKAKSGKT